MQSDAAVEMCDEILELIEDIDLKKSGNPDWEEFSESVSEKVEDMKGWIEDNDYCTEAQAEALVNMRDGVGRWSR